MPDRPFQPAAGGGGVPSTLAPSGAAEVEVPVTIRDVVARAGVALSSAPRVLSGHPDVSAAMRLRA
jgi:hypothetical protein